MHEKSWYENEIYMDGNENEISMHENDIPMHENENDAPKMFIAKSSMHEIVYSPNTHENICGHKIIPGADIPFSCMEISMHAYMYMYVYL